MMRRSSREQTASETAPTFHRLIQGDAREMPYIPDESVHLVVTSPPYWNLKRYNDTEGQLGHVADYEEFLGALEQVWRECYRALVPGGRLVCVVGDVCLSRRKYGRHLVMPLHADIVVMCRRIGLDNLNPIIWAKIANANYEVENGSKFLGKPYEPNAIIKNDIEFILMQRKPGGYRQPTEEQRRLSKLSKKEYADWFRQFWTMTGASTRHHPAPFPFELAHRLVRMFSFAGDTVLDPFCGTGTTMLAALKTGRNSIGIDIDPEYCRMALRRLDSESGPLFALSSIEYHTAADLTAPATSAAVADAPARKHEPARRHRSREPQADTECRPERSKGPSPCRRPLSRAFDNPRPLA